MTDAPAVPFLKRVWTRSAASGHRHAAARHAADRNAKPVEIYAPDRGATDLLLQHAAPVFPAEIAPGSVWIVRLQPPAGEGWVFELLALVDRWLESARLPWANVLYDGRNYLIRSSAEVSQLDAAADSFRGLSAHRSRARA